MMRKAKFFILTCLMLILTLTTYAQNTTKTYDWTKVMNAIIQVESKGDAKTHNPKGDCAGILQITPICVKECNQILQKKKSNKRYTKADRYNVEKSKEMFILMQEHFNPERNIEKAIKCWNSGFFHKTKDGWKSKSKGYYKEVMKYYNGGN